MNVKNYERICYTAVTALLLGNLACSTDTADGAITGEALVQSIAEGDTALTIPGECPAIDDDNDVVATLPLSEGLSIAQAYVGDPSAVNPQTGDSENLHAARITDFYLVDLGEESVHVFCGPDNGVNGAPFKGVMLVAGTTPGLILD